MKFSICIWIVVVSGFLMCAVVAVDVPQQVDRWLWYPKEMDAQALTSAHRTEIIAELRRRAISTSQSGNQYTAKCLLLRLGDKQTITEVLRDLKDGDTHYSAYKEALHLLGIPQPLFIPPLAEMLDLPGKATDIRRGDSVSYSTPLSAALAIQHILTYSPEFSQDTRTWANSVRISFDYEIFRDTFRQWWQQNKEHFEKQDYAAVQPLKPVVAAPNPQPVQTNGAPTIPRALPAKKAAVTNSAQVEAPEPASALPAKLIVVVVGLTLTVAVLVVLRLKLKN